MMTKKQPTRKQVKLPPKIGRILKPDRGSYRYRGLHGGRGSGKSQGVATIAAIWGYKEPLRILCTREYQASIAESFHAELRAAIERYDFLSRHYEVGKDYITGANGTQLFFRGLRHNSQAIKSIAGVDLTIIEEAETVPEQSWLDLEATVFRKPNSEIIAIWNPQVRGSPVDKRLRQNPPGDALVGAVQWRDNPFFPANLDKLRRDQQTRLDPSMYAHIWEGEYLERSEAQVLQGKWRVDEFDPGADWDGPYYGLDWGFAQDPTAAVRLWVHDGRLYVEHEAHKVGLELDHTIEFLTSKIPGIAEHAVLADSARPESISYMQRHGLPRIMPVHKWQGSVQDGIAHMLSYREIIVHPRCTEWAREGRLYSHKVDRTSGLVMPDIVDAHNHLMDATRYALQPMIKIKGAPRVRSL
jgi:phage terminase large subunit